MQEVDPCDDLTDEDIRTAIQNASGPKNVLFVPEVQLGMVLFFSHCTLQSNCVFSILNVIFTSSIVF